MSKPNFFIIGTPKSGTTSLFYHLDAHPEVFTPKIKEPHYFSHPEVKSTYYKTNIISNEQNYLNLYKNVENEKAIGDLSTSYFFNYDSAERIKEFNKDAKVIVVLRNPVERAISHYLMDFSLGYINLPLDEVLKNEKDYKSFYNQYVNIGFYEKPLKKFIEVFGRANILIILSDNLFNKTEKTLENVFNFIGVDTNLKLELFKKRNQFKKPKHPFVKKILKSETANKIINIFPESIKENLKLILFDKNVEKPIFREERKKLKRLYLDSINNTSNLLNLNLDSWK